MIARPVGLALASAAVILSTAVLARFLQAANVIDAESVKRMVSVVIGLWLAVWGNYMPKRWGAPVAPGCALSRLRSVNRVGGWAMMLAGLVFAAAWAFSPISVARPVAVGAVASATLVMMAYAAWAIATCGSRSAKRAPTAF